MSAIFPKRGRRENTADQSFVDLDAPPPITEKRQHSPFSYFRMRKRSTEGTEEEPPAKRYWGVPADSLAAPLAPSDSSNDSTVSFPTPHTQPEKFATQWDAPSADNILPVAYAMLPTPTPMMAATAMIASQSLKDNLPTAGPGHNTRALVPAGHVHGLLATAQMDKAKVAATVGPLITMGMQNLTKAQTVVGEIVASEAWSVVKENATADVVMILDSITKYIPALMVAESVFSVIIKHELDRHENDKNILVVYHTMSIFWFTMCDLQAIFRADKDHIKTSLDQFFQAVGSSYLPVLSLIELVRRISSSLISFKTARTLRSSEYRTKLTGFAQAFTEHKATLQFILTESSAIQITDMSATVTSVASKLDDAMAFIARQTPLELSVARQVQENGGDRAFEALTRRGRIPHFLNQLAKNSFGVEEISPQVQASLRQGLDEALSANMPMFTLKIEAAQKEMEEAVERSTETILQQLNSGPYQLIKDEDIKAVWQSTCKARHFVDAVHNHFAQIFGDHRQSSGEMHADQWTLNVLSQSDMCVGSVLYLTRLIGLQITRTISDAIDDDGSGYISVHEVNHFFKSRPQEWSAVQWLSYWAAGWKQKCACARNRRSVKSYIKTSGLSELWLAAPETEPLNALRAEIMHKERARIRPETVLAGLGTHRLEGFILCFLELILERHRQILDAANTHVLAERELETMTFSLRNLVAAFSTSIQQAHRGWKQQRLDTDFLVQCFAGGIFNDWHEHPTAHNEAVETPRASDSPAAERAPREHSPPRLEDILLFPLPQQPSSRSSHRLAPLPLPQGPRRNSASSLVPKLQRASIKRRNPHNRISTASADYFFHFDFERRPSERPAASSDPASISEVYPKNQKLEDRIKSLETELSDIKGMLGQLIQLSTPRRSEP
ncbi:hypothetical protein B0H14DRAFT_2762006 [Mycena olivaceomarginata]|nr:hypothetical protein B0H14DRAFT_2762006 [Mycena olivaceomarginata]